MRCSSLKTKSTMSIGAVLSLEVEKGVEKYPATIQNLSFDRFPTVQKHRSNCTGGKKHDPYVLSAKSGFIEIPPPIIAVALKSPRYSSCWIQVRYLLHLPLIPATIVTANSGRRSLALRPIVQSPLPIYPYPKQFCSTLNQELRPFPNK